MAIHVDYWEDAKPEHYKEGPFVICGPPQGDRTKSIEVQSPYAQTCVCLELAIHKFIEAHHGADWRSRVGHVAVADWLNAEVAAGRITNESGKYLPVVAGN